MQRKKHFEEEYDVDNIAYMNDYDNYENDDESEKSINIEDQDEYDEFDEDSIDDEDDTNQDVFTGENLSMYDLGGRQEFDPTEYDFDKIMEDYHSKDDKRRKFAINQAARAMDALVKHVINRHYPTYREKYYEDMLQEGRMAVVETLGGYTGRCAPSSYFYTTIRHQIQVFIAEIVHRTTRHYAAMANKIRKAEIALSQMDGKDSHDDLTISVYTGLPLTTVIETRRQTLAADFAELNPNIDAEATLQVNKANPDAALWEKAKSNAIFDAINRLSPMEATVIKMMYGLNGDKACNAPEIARRLHIKTEQVRKISQDAFRKLSQDNKLKQDVDVHDRLTKEQNKSSSELSFMPVVFGKGTNFFDEISEEDNEESTEASDFTDLFKSMSFGTD